MYEYGVSFKSVRHLQEYGRFHYYSKFFNNDKVSGAHALSGHLAKHENPIIHAVSRVSQNLSLESLNQSIFSYLGNVLHSDTPLIFAIIMEVCRI